MNRLLAVKRSGGRLRAKQECITDWVRLIKYIVFWLIRSSGLSKIHRTQDGGSSFQQVFTFPDTLERIHFKDINTGWASDKKGKVWITTSGGTAWEPINQFEFGPLALQVVSATTGFFCLQNSVYEKRAGITTRTLFVPNHPLSDIHFTDESHGWAVSPIFGTLYRFVK